MKKKKQNDEAPLPAREAALRILERTGISAPVQSLLDTKLTGGLFSRQEAALTTELVYGYLRSEIRISWLLSQFMKAPEKLPASMKLMIGIAAYELLYLDRIPAHASVSAAVDAVRARFGQGLSRVANGVLRSLIRLSESEDLKAFAFYESRIKDPMERLSVFHSVPRWMLELWTKGYGPEKAETFARAVSVVPSPCVRVNAARDEWEALRDFLCKEGEAVGISGVRFAPGTQPEYMRDYLRQGRLSIQGAGSQLALEALDAPRWEGPVWDACAGRGGKTLAAPSIRSACAFCARISITSATTTPLPSTIRTTPSALCSRLRRCSAPRRPNRLCGARPGPSCLMSRAAASARLPGTLTCARSAPPGR